MTPNSTFGDSLTIVEPSTSVAAKVSNGMIYVKVYVCGDSTILEVHAQSHTSSTPLPEPNNEPLSQIPGTSNWEGCIPGYLGGFYVTACATFDEGPMAPPRHVHATSGQITGVEGDEPRCGN